MFIPWVCGEYDYSDRVNRMAVVVKSQDQKIDMEKKEQKKATEEDTKKLAASMFLEAAMMQGGDAHKKAKNKNKVAPLAIEDADGGGRSGTLGIIVIFIQLH